ncbi:hypothetical protein [Tenacibaculum caenipelagi]|uniref:Uncharacterized protein n=1 Tax=Tenacibaculum caenipelagi TaxID=1325435 RepID=A0A4R6TH85_9FLAO|nr:hypothetical protein [Tenacibaculum caenipelagi]TDQ29943.1 hypothetical protein DFQ07_0269 [Tenacibaculum caenipelagi]
MDFQKEYDRIADQIGRKNILLSFLYNNENKTIEYPNAKIEYLPTGEIYLGDIFDDKLANALYAIKQLKRDLK